MYSNGTMRRVFVSHCHADSLFASRLANDLRESLLDDDAVICSNALMKPDPPGSDRSWYDEISREISERSIFLIVLSPAALNSRFVMREIETAQQQAQSLRDKIIIGLQYQTCSIPQSLKDQLIVSFSPPTEYDDALAELQGVMLDAIEVRQRPSTMLLPLAEAPSTLVISDSESPMESSSEIPSELFQMLSPGVLSRLREHLSNNTIQDHPSHYPREMIVERLDEYLDSLVACAKSDDDNLDQAKVTGSAPIPLSHGQGQPNLTSIEVYTIGVNATYTGNRIGDNNYVDSSYCVDLETPTCLEMPRVPVITDNFVRDWTLWARQFWLDAYDRCRQTWRYRIGEVTRHLIGEVAQRLSDIAASMTSVELRVAKGLQVMSNRGRRVQRNNPGDLLCNDSYFQTWDSCLTLIQRTKRYLRISPGLLSGFPAIDGTSTAVSRQDVPRLPNSAAQHVLAIGIGTYESSHLPDLPVSVRDAQAVYTAYANMVDLEQRERSGVFKQVLTNSEASIESVRAALHHLAIQCRSDDVVTVYFTGHGLHEQEHGRLQDYLCFSNTDPHNLSSTALSRDELLETLDRIGSRRLLLVMDTCRSSDVAPNAAGWLRQSMVSSALSDDDTVVVAYRVSRSPYRHVTSDRSPFRQYLEQAFEHSGANNFDDCVTALDLYRYMSEAMQHDGAFDGLGFENP